MRWNNKKTRRKTEKFKKESNSLANGRERMNGVNALNNLKNPKTKNN
jgi:hypothetical protein